MCPNGYFVNGFYRSNSDKIAGGINGGVHNLEKARCTRPNEAPPNGVIATTKIMLVEPLIKKG